MCLNRKIKYTSIFWTLIVAMMLCITGLLWAGGAFAAEKVSTIHCKAHKVDFINNGSDYLFAKVDFEKGNFRELPSDSEESISFYNLDTKKVLTVYGRSSDVMYMAVYKSVEDYRAQKPEYQDNCHF